MLSANKDLEHGKHPKCEIRNAGAPIYLHLCSQNPPGGGSMALMNSLILGEVQPRIFPVAKVSLVHKIMKWVGGVMSICHVVNLQEFKSYPNHH